MYLIQNEIQLIRRSTVKHVFCEVLKEFEVTKVFAFGPNII